MQVSDPALRFWLSTTFQNTIEVSQHLSKLEAPEETPYVHKYTAIKALKTLLEREHTFHFIVQLALAELYSEVDQLSDSVRSYEAALVSLSRLPKGQLPLFGNYLLVLFNMLGLTYINREDSQQGIGCLAKAMNIYEQLKGSLAHGPDFYHSRADKPNGRTFRYSTREESIRVSLRILTHSLCSISPRHTPSLASRIRLQRIVDSLSKGSTKLRNMKSTTSVTI